MTITHKRPIPRKDGSITERPDDAAKQAAAAKRPAHYPEYLFGLHERGGEHLMLDADRAGWVLELAAIGLDGNSTPADFTDLSKAGLGVIVRINHGYGSTGTLPTPDRYAEFAAACARYVQRSHGCHIWIVGNEPNHEVERPNGQLILPHDYARAYSLCRATIRGVKGHAQDQVLVAGPAPWNATTTYPGNEKGDWVRYFVHVMTALADDGCDGFALHTYTHALDPRQITGDFYHTTPGYRHLRNEFRTYQDFMNAIPDRFRHLPVFITETDPTTRGRGWDSAKNVGWVQAAYREIANWNRDPLRQPILSLILYRWPQVPDQPEWSISNRPGIIEDFRQALRADKPAHFQIRMPSRQQPVVIEPGKVLPAGQQWQGLVMAPLGLNQRSGPSTDHAILQVLPNETALLVLAELDDWLYVKALDRPGYVHRSFVLRQSPATTPKPPRTYLRERAELLQAQLAPKPEAQLAVAKTASWSEQAVAATWNQFGALVTRLAKTLEIDPAVAVSVLAIESGGNAFAQDGRMTIRFENHIFFEEWGKQDPERFAQHFRFELEHPWRGHQWRPDPNGEWRDLHGDQDAEWAAFEFARTQLNGPAALRSISMGAPQIMGFNHEQVGFLAPEAMFDEFTGSPQAQVVGFFDFVNTEPARLEALRNGDFLAFAMSYNGEGQAPLYAMLIQDAIQTFKRLRAAPAAATSRSEAPDTDTASQLPAPTPDPTSAEVDPELHAAWRKHILEGFDHNRHMFDRLLDAFMGPYQTTVWMYRTLFGVGLTAFVVAAVAGIWTGEVWVSAAFGGLGVAAFVSYFISHPLRALEENLNFITWLGVIYNSYWTRLVYAMDQETVQQDLAAMTEEFVQQVERLIDKHTQTSQNRPGLR